MESESKDILEVLRAHELFLAVDAAGVRADLGNAIHAWVVRNGANLGQVLMISLDCKRANFSETDLSGAVLASGNYDPADFSMANLTHANLKGAILNQCSFRFAKFVDATLYGASMPACDFRGAGLTDMDLQESRLCTIEVSDAKTEKKWRD